MEFPQNHITNMVKQQAYISYRCRIKYVLDLFLVVWIGEYLCGIKAVTLNKNQTHEMLKVDKRKATFPLLLSFNFAVTTPLNGETDSLDSSDNEEEEQIENIN